MPVRLSADRGTSPQRNAPQRAAPTTPGALPPLRTIPTDAWHCPRCVEARRYATALDILKKAELLCACPEILDRWEMAQLKAFVDDSHASLAPRGGPWRVVGRLRVRGESRRRLVRASRKKKSRRKRGRRPTGRVS